MNKHILDECALIELNRERNSVYFRKNQKKDGRRMIVTCSPSIEDDHYSVGFNGNPLKAGYDPVIKFLLENRIGYPLGAHTEYVRHGSVGSCAEPHAANMVLKNHPGSNVTDYVFSSAFLYHISSIPRDYCLHCLMTFEQLSNE